MCNIKARNQTFRPLFGEVYFVNFPAIAGVFRGWHPGIIVQNDRGNAHSPSVIVVPLTSKVNRLDIPSNVMLPAPDAGLIKTSMAMCGSVQTVPKWAIGDYITTIPEEFMQKIAAAFTYAMPLITYLDEGDIPHIRQQAMEFIS